MFILILQNSGLKEINRVLCRMTALTIYNFVIQLEYYEWVIK